MEAKTQLKYLRIINYLNFELNLMPNNSNEQNANVALLKAMRDFLSKYSSEIKKKYTFVVKYEHDIYSFLALRICHAAVTAIRKTIDIRILGDLTKEEQEFFKDFKSIGLKKAKKLKQCVLITGFNPILNVENEMFLSKKFIMIHHPIERLTPIDLYTLMNFYLKEDSFLYKKDLKATNWSFFYQTPVGLTNNFEMKELAWDISPDDIYQKCDKNIPIVAFKLKGTEEDLDTFDIIYKSSKEGNIHLYIIEGDRNFVINNLISYLDCRNVPQDINIMDEKKAYEILELAAENIDTNFINTDDVKKFGVDAILKQLGGENNENSNS